MKKLLGLILLVSWSISVWADVPKLLNYQGRLTDSENKAVADDDYIVNFRLYISEAEVNSVWNETQTIATKDGYFHALLGQVNALTLSIFNQPLWLGIQVQGEAEMTPRQQLASSPAALTVADGVISSAKLAFDVTLPVGTIMAWHKSQAHTPQILPAQWAECNGQTLIDPESPYNGDTLPNLNSASGTGRFLRGSDHSGDMQEDQTGSHVHNYTYSDFPEFGEGFGSGTYYKPPVTITGTTDPNNPVGSETRPINMSVVWIIKIK